MATLFTRIIEGELPGRFVWKDERCVGFLSIHPLRPGHVLVVPRDEIEDWLDLAPDLASHVLRVAQTIGRGLRAAFRPVKVAVMIAGLEVPHVHVHLVPVDDVHDLDFERQDMSPDPADLDDAAERIRQALSELGYTEESTP